MLKTKKNKSSKLLLCFSFGFFCNVPCLIYSTQNDTQPASSTAVQNNGPFVTTALFAGIPRQSGNLIGQSVGCINNARVTQFNTPFDIVFDQHGQAYVSDSHNNQIKMISREGFVQILAGLKTGQSGTQDDVGTAASFKGPTALAVDNLNNVLYVADQGTLIRVISIVTKAVTTLNLNMRSFSFSSITDIALDNPNSPEFLFVTTSTNQIFKIKLLNGSVHVVAGQANTRGLQDDTGDAAQFNSPQQMYVDTDAGIIYVADQGNNAIRMLVPTTSPNGKQTTYTVSTLVLNAALPSPVGLVRDAHNGFYVSTAGHFIYYLQPSSDPTTPTQFTVTQIIGNVITQTNKVGPFWNQHNETKQVGGYAESFGTNALFDLPYRLSIDPANTIYVVDQNNHCLRYLI